MSQRARTRIITLLLVLIWMGLIFYFSAQNADSSGRLSGALSERLARFQSKVLHLGWSKRKIMEISTWLETPLRKCAHASEYAVLGILVRLHLHTRGLPKRSQFLLAEVICVLYAISDELHQLFVEGRSGQFTDVCIDGAGALVGIILMTGILARYVKRREKDQLCSNSS